VGRGTKSRLVRVDQCAVSPAPNSYRWVSEVAPLSHLPLPERLARKLVAAGITSVEELTGRCRRELELPGIGPAALDEIEAALQAGGLALAEDEWAFHVCARHGQPHGDASARTFWLCDECIAEFQEKALLYPEPKSKVISVSGYCQHCNLRREAVWLVQWRLCTPCQRVLNSIGRSIVAGRYLEGWWEEDVRLRFPHLELRSTDVPVLQRVGAVEREAKVDYEVGSNTGEVVFRIELKAGGRGIGSKGVVAPLTRFQLDLSDCDEIVASMNDGGMPTYVVHVQVRVREDDGSPTHYYAALGAWWTEPFTMRDHYQGTDQRQGERKVAAYFATSAFKPIATFVERLSDGGVEAFRERLRREGIPLLYER